MQPDPDAETQTLIKYLNAQRRHALSILEDLTDAQLRQPLLPSGWSCLGLIQHLALDVERFWFQGIVAGNALDFGGITNAWIVPEDVSTASLFELYRTEATLADAVIAAVSLSDPPRWWPVEQFGTFRLHEVRDIVLHVITETAVHAGHLDIIRELIDGHQWLVLTD